MTDYISRLQRLDMPIGDDPQIAQAAAEKGKNYLACIIAHPGETPSGESGYSFELHLLPALSERARQSVAKGTIERILRLQEHGPELDAWQTGHQGVLRRWLTFVELDPWLTEN